MTLPRAGNIGGGGFMLVYDAESGETTAIDYREMAPLGATRDMFLDENGDADPNLSRTSHLASAVPGTVSGFWHAHQEFGHLPWSRLVEPSIVLARDGIVVSHDLAATSLLSEKNAIAATRRPAVTSTRPAVNPMSSVNDWCSPTWPIRCN